MADKHVTVEQPGEDFNLAIELSLDLHSLLFFKFLPYFRFLIFKQTRVNELPLGKSEAQHQCFSKGYRTSTMISHVQRN